MLKGEHGAERPSPSQGQGSLSNVRRLYWPPLHCPGRSWLDFWACIISENIHGQSYHEFNTILFRLLKNLWRLHIFIIKIHISQSCIMQKVKACVVSPWGFHFMLLSEFVFYSFPQSLYTREKLTVYSGDNVWRRDSEDSLEDILHCPRVVEPLVENQGFRVLFGIQVFLVFPLLAVNSWWTGTLH